MSVTPRRPCLFLFMLLLLAMASNSARAEFEVSGELIGYSDDCPISFARLQVRNRTPNKVRYEMTFTGGGRLSSQVSVGPFEVEPDGERVLDVPVPMLPHPSVIVNANGRRFGAPLNRPAYNGIYFLNIADLENWASEKELDSFSANYHSRGPYSSYGSSTGPGTRILAQLEPNRLPENWLCYAPYRGVMIKESAYERLSAGVKTALMNWVDAGGSLLVYGSEKHEMVNQMNGKIRFQSKNPFTFTAHELPEEWRRVSQQWQGNNQWQHATGLAAEDKNFPYGLRQISGRGGAFGLATAFLVMAGPLNYYYFRRRGQIRKLMISLPAISVAFCVLIMAYFIITQGFTKQGGSFAVTLLDESRGAAMTFARHSVFSGLYPLDGFRFAREAAFVPLRKAEDFTIELGPKSHLRSGIFQPTANFHYQTAFPHTTREKLIYKREDKSVMNGFEKHAELVVLRDNGNWYVARGIAPGGKSKLERIPENGSNSLKGTGGGILLNTLTHAAADWSDEEKRFLIGPMSIYAAAPLPDDVSYAVSFAEIDEESMQPGLQMDGARMRHVLINVSNKAGKAFSSPLQNGETVELTGADFLEPPI